jgi:Reverse transcriptase (RNA-dependent DNA polymerase).
MQGVGTHSRPPADQIPGTDTMHTIHKQRHIPHGRPVTYGNFICDCRPLKDEPWCMQLTVGGNKLTYDNGATAPSSQVTKAKLLFNSVISDHKKMGAKFAIADIKNFYLNNPLTHFQYMKILHKDKIPPKIHNEYNTNQWMDDHGYVYFEIRKGMYGLKEAGIVAWQELVRHLKQYGYEPMHLATGMWCHKTKPTIFMLTVDNFGIKYCSDTDLQHLLAALQDKYAITVDQEGTRYCGMMLQWCYQDGYIDVGIPGYIKEALHQLQHPHPTKPVHAPHQEWWIIQYGQMAQKSRDDEPSTPLDAAGKKQIQCITGKFLYYARAIDHIMLVALNE